MPGRDKDHSGSTVVNKDKVRQEKTCVQESLVMAVMAL